MPVLADMEQAGITIDPDRLRKLSNDFANDMAALETDIHKLAGGSFNIGSPKQLGEILFDRFKLPGGTQAPRPARGRPIPTCWKTWRLQGHDIAKKVLAWRQLQKLRGTYTDALPSYINPKTGRVHTSYAMASTSTGRLASTDPNLQNIPIRTEEGRRIRAAFIAAKGMKLISADYSQIELRLLAHIADIPALKKAFAEGLDIHAMTASEIFGVPVKDMPSEIRRRAKAINFGIVYGISGFGLANQLGIPRGEADDYIKKYFQRFPGIRDYMEDTKAVRARARLCRNPVRAARPYPRDQVDKSRTSRRRGTRGDQRADPGRGRRHHPPRHDPRARRACRSKAQSTACCCRCMTN